MLLKDAAKMIHDKFDEEFPKMEMKEMTKFDVAALSLGKGKGYWVVVYANEKSVAIISSKRVDKRVFKTLEAIRSALDEVGITRFEVIGTK
ncbi:hypothetical protein NVP1265O_59 [Vibrio phage 1.265.O._10N.286.52.F6]|nr:hypothetical protein NVP1265O_59 [Vibrio phage 1.265.O._10N.286.52.F6]